MNLTHLKVEDMHLRVIRKHVYLINHSLASTLKNLPRISVHWSTKLLWIWWVIYISLVFTSKVVLLPFFLSCIFAVVGYVWSHHFSYSCAFLSLIGCFFLFLFLFFFWVIYWWDAWCINYLTLPPWICSVNLSFIFLFLFRDSFFTRFTFCLLPYPLRFIAKLWSGSSYSSLVTVFLALHS